MSRGYTRGSVIGVGRGAAEWWRSLLADAPPLSGSDRPLVGEVREVYDRSAYLELTSGIDATWPPSVAPLVLLCGPGIEGPLATRVRTPHGHSIRDLDIERGMDCRLHRAATPGGDGAVVVSIGSAFDCSLDPAILDRTRTTTSAPGEVTTVQLGDERWRRGRRLVDHLAQENHEDGLGRLAALRSAREAVDLPPRWYSLVETWTGIVRGNAEAGEADPWVTLLGRGPGATPSGDDVVAGLLLVLLAGTTGAEHDRVRMAAEHTVSLAAERTTAISTALLAQAARGRAGPAIERCLHELVDTGSDWCRLEATAEETVAVGHTSGVDTLLGMLIGVLFVGPALRDGR